MNALDPNARGALFMVVGMLGFTINDTLMKVVLADVPLFQALFLRGLVASAILGLLVARTSGFAAGLLPIRPGLVLRVGAEVGGTICFFTALIHMPIADATAIMQVMPLAVTLGAALFLGERVGWRRSVAIVIGFGGVMIILRPGSGTFNSYAYLPLFTVVLIAARDLATRRLPPGLSSSMIAFLTSLATTMLAGLASIAQPWAPVDGRLLALIVSAALLLCIGYLFSVMTMRVGDISFSAPFRYTGLVWAIIAGMVVFGDVPDLWMLLGSAVVVGTGVYTILRERRLARAGKVTPITSTIKPQR